jgi:hypothetical protein
VLGRTPQVTPPYLVCYLASYGNFGMHRDERYLGGCLLPFHKFHLPGKTAGLETTILRVSVVGPIRAKNCKSCSPCFEVGVLSRFPLITNENAGG